MTASRKSPLQDFPAVVQKRAKMGIPPEGAFEAVVAHYGLSGQYAKLGSATGELETAQAAASFYRALAQSLMSHLLPSFRGHRAGGRPKSAAISNGLAWSEAGGGLIGGPMAVDGWEKFYQAQLVELVDRLGREKKKSQAWVFEHLAKKDRHLLPRIFRERKTAASLKNAYNKIPAEVRADPSRYLPSTSRGPYPPATSMLEIYRAMARNGG